MISRLNLESLETREVPAVLLNGDFTGSTGNGTFKAVADGGNVMIQEIGGTFTAFGTNGLNPTTVTKSNTAADNITLTNNGGTLTVNDTDGVFIKLKNGNLINVGTTLDVQNATGLNVNLQLGGDDTVNDNTTLTATVNGGTGNDTIKAGGGAFNPLLLQFLQQPGGINPALLPLLGGGGGQKTLQGGAGNDSITGPFFGIFNMLDGGDGNDTLIGGFGPDIITGGNGFDIMFGFGGGDFYVAFDFGPDFILDQPGDTVFGDPFDL